MTGSTLEALLASRSERMTASEIRELLKLLDRPGVISFAGGIPDPKLFDVAAFRAAYDAVLSDPATAQAALQYTISEGHPPLRGWIVEHMRTLGVEADPDNILITAGSQQALDFSGKLFLGPGDTVLVTAPTYLGALQAFNAYEPRYDTLGGNATPDSLLQAARDAGSRIKLLYIVPDFANPTGVTLSLEERERLLDLATEVDALVVEDAAYNALLYDGAALPPIAALDARRSGGIDRGRTIYCGSFSKTLSPGLRVGWMCGPRDIISRMTLAKQAGDLHTSTMNQNIVHRVAERIYPAQVEKIRASYRRRRDAMLAALERSMPAGVEWTRPRGGMFVWVTLPASMDGRRLLQHCLDTENIAFVPGQAFFADGSGRNTIRLNFSLPGEEAIADGIARLGRAIRTLGDAPGRGA